MSPRQPFEPVAPTRGHDSMDCRVPAAPGESLPAANIAPWRSRGPLNRKAGCRPAWSRSCATTSTKPGPGP